MYSRIFFAPLPASFIGSCSLNYSAGSGKMVTRLPDLQCHQLVRLLPRPGWKLHLGGRAPAIWRLFPGGECFEYLDCAAVFICCYRKHRLTVSRSMACRLYWAYVSCFLWMAESLSSLRLQKCGHHPRHHQPCSHSKCQSQKGGLTPDCLRAC